MVLAAGPTAVRHLLGKAIVPLLVRENSSHLGRLLFHAVVVVVETGVLIVLFSIEHVIALVQGEVVEPSWN